MGRYIVVQPALEPNPRIVRRFGKFAAFAYFRWSCFAVGFDFLTAGFALHIGPLMVGLCHIKHQLTAYERKEARFIDKGGE